MVLDNGFLIDNQSLLKRSSFSRISLSLMFYKTCELKMASAEKILKGIIFINTPIY